MFFGEGFVIGKGVMFWMEFGEYLNWITATTTATATTTTTVFFSVPAP